MRRLATLHMDSLTSLFPKSTYETMATSRVETKEHLWEDVYSRLQCVKSTAL